MRRAIALALALGLLGVPAGAKTLAKERRTATRGSQPAWGPVETSPLRPGASLGGYCTFNFLYYTPGTATKAPVAYIGTAGHCTDEVGERVENPAVGEVGTVVYDSDAAKSAVDFSLVRLDPGVVEQANPQMFGWEGPTGVTELDALSAGDRIDVYGYGLGVGMFEQTRPRYGVLFDWDEHEYQADMPAVNGDSGAPLLHHPTGTAFGIISRYGLPPEVLVPSTDHGPLMVWILEELAKAGFKDLRLATI